MQIRERSRFVAIVGLVTVILSAGFASAGDTFEDPADGPAATCEPTPDIVGDGNASEGSDHAEGTGADHAEDAPEPDGIEDPAIDEGCDDAADAEHPVEDVEEPGESEEPDDSQPALEVSEERVAECTEAAGLTGEDAPDEEPTPGEPTGLENAIAHVLRNCLRNENDGLVNALEHLHANMERKLGREERKAERKAEREARKAERNAAKAEREAERAAGKAEREAAKAAGQHGQGS
jgi:hypothetical protein